MVYDYDLYDAILQHIFQRTNPTWFKPLEENLSAGVCLRVEHGHFRVFPYENLELAPFEAAIRALNPLVAVKVRSAAVHAALATVADDAQAIFVDSNTRIQIIDSITRLPRADKEQCAAFIRDEAVLVVWSDHLDTIIPICRDFEDRLIKLVWENRPATLVSIPSTLPPSVISSTTNLGVLAKEKEVITDGLPQAPDELPYNAPKRRLGFGFFRSKKPSPATDVDLEKKAPKRQLRLYAPVYNGLSAGLSFYYIGLGVSILMQEYMLDGDVTRFALLVVTPFVFCVSLFFSMTIISDIALIIGPIAQYHENSKYYSAVKPLPNKEIDDNLPHITIQMPVYKESLDGVIAPSVYSLKKAIQTYARQGGTCSIFVCDDGLQLIKSDEERNTRIQFYADHGIGWVARPGHDSQPDGYKRAGRFKKASNMNYGLQLSLALERHLAKILEDETNGLVTATPEQAHLSYEDRALELAIQEVYAGTGNRFMPWASNGKALRMGEIILIVDSDTVVPEDCLRDAARELHESPEVAIIQHESEVMQVAHHYFENGIAYFTRRINRSISMACANGEVAPFVGHNAFLRWSAIQDAAFVDPADGVRKHWSEMHVSEDFDQALRLQLAGYCIRWASYSNGEFREGVSLTCDDELNRWEKYAYGCSELIFNPFIQWWRKGPVTPQLHRFVWSGAPIHYKIGMMAYMFSYYGIAAGFAMSFINYVVLGWQLPISGFYFHSFESWLSTTAVFPIAGNISFTIMEYRLGQKSLIRAAVDNIIWLPYFFFFFGGLSLHISKAILAHMFSYNMSWGATKKEVERSNFFVEIPKILKRFRVALVICIIIAAGMIVLATPLVPSEWRIPPNMGSVVFPLALVVVCHMLYPIVLNPWLLKFSY